MRDPSLRPHGDRPRGQAALRGGAGEVIVCAVGDPRAPKPKHGEPPKAKGSAVQSLHCLPKKGALCSRQQMRTLGVDAPSPIEPACF